MIDICGNDRAARSHFVAHEFRRHAPGHALGETGENSGGIGAASRAGVLVAQGTARLRFGEGIAPGFEPLILADGDILHLGGDEEPGAHTKAE